MMQNLFDAEDSVFDILHDYYSRLDRFADDLDRAARLRDPSLQNRARALADLVETYEGAFSDVLYPLLDDGARGPGLAQVHAASLASMLRDGLSAARASMLRRSIDGYLQRVHAPIVSAAKMRFAREKALAVGRALREALAR